MFAEGFGHLLCRIVFFWQRLGAGFFLDGSDLSFGQFHQREPFNGLPGAIPGS
jgi:hypothetical protein